VSKSSASFTLTMAAYNPICLPKLLEAAAWAAVDARDSQEHQRSQQTTITPASQAGCSSEEGKFKQPAKGRKPVAEAHRGHPKCNRGIWLWGASSFAAGVMLIHPTLERLHALASAYNKIVDNPGLNLRSRRNSNFGVLLQKHTQDQRTAVEVGQEFFASFSLRTDLCSADRALLVSTPGDRNEPFLLSPHVEGQ
jgi:hypothetical protein